MEQCNNSGCTKPAEVEKVLETPFSMTSTSTNSQKTIKVCADCDAQDKRMEELNK